MDKLIIITLISTLIAMTTLILLSKKNKMSKLNEEVEKLEGKLSYYKRLYEQENKEVCQLHKKRIISKSDITKNYKIAIFVEDKKSEVYVNGELQEFVTSIAFCQEAPNMPQLEIKKGKGYEYTCGYIGDWYETM